MQHATMKAKDCSNTRVTQKNLKKTAQCDNFLTPSNTTPEEFEKGAFTLKTRHRPHYAVGI